MTRTGLRGAGRRWVVPRWGRGAAVLLAAVALVGPPAVAVPAAGAAPLPAIPVGVFGWPLAGLDASGPPAAGAAVRVTHRFLPPPTPYGRGHRGVDLAAPPGSPVLAAGPGTVVFAAVLAGRPVVSVLHPGGLRTTYEPVAAGPAVGTPVARGTPLGTLAPGHVGCPAPACLHWGLRQAVPDARTERYLDPLLLVGLGRSRLLPWPAG